MPSPFRISPGRSCATRCWLLAAALMVPAVAPGAADHRLDRDVVPVAQSLDLTLDPAADGYPGITTIRLDVRAACDSFSLHALDLQIQRLELSTRSGPVPVRWGIVERGRLKIETTRTLPPGPAVLFVSFHNDYDRRANALYRFDHEGRAYLATQFEAVAAREAFPCWDEPDFRIPWTVTVRTPERNLVIGNTAVESSRVAGGFRETRLRTTRPLPSYLLALAVGPYERVPVPGLSVPVRIVTVRGAARWAGPAARVVRRVLPALERWFGSRLPYDKLDLIALPEYVGGAMENVGAITFHAPLLLHDAATFSPIARTRLTGLLAHEIAHHWFGGRVTMAWWDDLWLNEAFATFVSDDVTAALEPGTRALADPVTDAQRAYARDATGATRAIRAPVDAHDNPDLLFDSIAYAKGAAVLRMLQSWAGESRFRAGVRAYLSRHADRSATAADLWAALGASAGDEVVDIARDFTEQPGAPCVAARLAPDGRAIRLRTRRWSAAGEPARPGAWRVPVTLLVARASRSSFDTLRVLLGSDDSTIALPHPAAWVHPNLDERGYYRWELDPDALAALLGSARTLSPAGHAGLPPTLGAMLRSGALAGDHWVRALLELGAEPAPPALAIALADAAADLHDSFGGGAGEHRVAATVRAVIGPTARALGVVPRPGEPAAAATARPAVWSALVLAGADTLERDRFHAWVDSLLAGRPGPPAAMEAIAMTARARDADAPGFARLRDAFLEERDPSRRQRWLEALGEPRDPARVAEALALAIDPALSAQETLDLIDAVGRDESRRDALLAWVRTAYATLARRLPDYERARLPERLGGCSRVRLAEIRAFFSDPTRAPAGTEASVARAVATGEACAGVREREGDRVRSALVAP